MATFTELKQALVIADKQGLDDTANKLAWAVRYEMKRRSNDPKYNVEGAHSSDPDVPGYIDDDVPWMKQEDQGKGMMSTVGDVVGGVIEAPIAAATAVASVPLGLGDMIHGAVESYLKAPQGQRVKAVDTYFRGDDNGIEAERAFARGSQAAQYKPRTDTGQYLTQGLAELTKSIPPIIAPGVSNLGAVGQAIKGAAPLARTNVIDPGMDAARAAVQEVKFSANELKHNAAIGAQKLRDVPRTVSDKVTASFRKTAEEPSDSTAGAQQVPLAELTRVQLDQLPVPMKVLPGVIGNDYPIRHEVDILKKMPDIGEPLRARESDTNVGIDRQFSAFEENIGNITSTRLSSGNFIDATFKKMMEKRKAGTSALYKKANDIGETLENVKLVGMVDFLNKTENRALTSESPVLKTSRRLLKNFGAAKEEDAIDDFGNSYKKLVVNDTTLKNAELIKQSIGDVVDASNSKEKGRAKRIINKFMEDTKESGGPVYKRARKSHQRYMNDFEDNELVRELVAKNHKSGERKIAIEKIAEKSIFSSNASFDRTEKMIKLLRKTKDGRQAIKEIKAAGLRKIRDKTFSNKEFDYKANRVPSYSKLEDALKELDETGKLDLIYGKKMAESLRTLRSVVQRIRTSPAGVIGHSNTATVLASIFDMFISISTGSFLPVTLVAKEAVKRIKDAKLRARVNQLLKDAT